MKGKMKAQVYYEPGKIKLEEVDIPQISDNEVLVKVKACGICGSDLSYYYGHSPVMTPDGKGPIILGHEFSGEIVEVGKIPQSMKLFKPGDRVIVNPVQQCNSCPACSKGNFNVCSNVNVLGVSTDGAFAEYCKSSFTHVYKIPDTMSYEEGAVAEPLACIMNGVSLLNVGIGDSVVVLGPGAIGNLAIQLIKARGAGKIILVGIIDYTLEKGKESGADILINTLDKNSPYYTEDLVKKISELTGGNLADKVIVTAGVLSAMQDALKVSGCRSTIVYFGLPGPNDELKVPMLNTLYAAKEIKFSWLAPLVWPSVINAMGTGRIDAKKVVTHKFSLEDVVKGIEFMKESKEDKLKGIIII